MSSDDVKRRFFSATKRRYQEVDVPLIGKVRIRNLTNAEMMAFKDSLLDDKGQRTARLDKVNELLVAQCVVDEAGDRAFCDEDAMGAAFGEIDGAPLAALYRACVVHTNYRQDPDWKAIEDAAKNSDATG
jgi:hypothetical protein